MQVVNSKAHFQKGWIVIDLTPSTALSTASPASVDEGAILPLLRLKPESHTLLFLSPPTSNLSGNPVGSAFKLYPELNPNTSHHLHCLHPGQTFSQLFVAWVLTAVVASYNFLCFYTPLHPPQSILNKGARGILSKHVRAGPSSAQNPPTKSL